MIVVVAGSMGRLPVGGHAWAHLQYLAGLAALGHDVWYLEECGPGSWVYDWEAEELTTDLSYPAAYVEACMSEIGLSGRWTYRTDEGSAGADPGTFADVCRQADLLLVYAVPLLAWRPEYAWPRRRAFVDGDPGFTQIALVQGDAALGETVARCERLFTVGQRLGAPDCPVPLAGRRWEPTVAPVVLAHWPVAEGPGGAFTCVLQWRGHRDVEHAGHRYGQKDRELPRFADLPRRAPVPLELAVTGAPPASLAADGWRVVPGHVASRTPASYRSYLASSRGELGIAKHGYVAMRGGWFSDRSVCYLASGRPVVVQDTGLGDWLDLGEGVLAFADVAGAVAALEEVEADYERHRRAARKLAEERFASERVLPALLAQALA